MSNKKFLTAAIIQRHEPYVYAALQKTAKTYGMFISRLILNLIYAGLETEPEIYEVYKKHLESLRLAKEKGTDSAQSRDGANYPLYTVLKKNTAE